MALLGQNRKKKKKVKKKKEPGYEVRDTRCEPCYTNNCAGKRGRDRKEWFCDDLSALE